MAKTTVPIELSSTPGIVDNSNATAITIDSSEKVGIGTSNPSQPLDVRAAQNGIARFYSTSAGGNAEIEFLTLNSASTVAKISKIVATQVGADTNGSILSFYTSPTSTNTAAERMRIDSSGSVGIGTDSPSAKLHVEGNQKIFGNLFLDTSADGFRAIAMDTSDGADNESLYLCGGGAASGARGAVIGLIGNEFTGTGGELNLIGGRASTGNIIFRTGPSSSIERMRIDTSGHLLVGTTDAGIYDDATDEAGHNILANGQYYNSTVSEINMILNRQNSDGDILQFRKDGSTVGAIGCTGGDLYINGAGGQIKFYISGSNEYEMDGSQFFAATDNSNDLGTASFRWDDVYATNGTIQTSDRNEKQDIAELSEAEARVAVAAKGLLRKFKWQDAVAEKGDEARIHFGIIAQDLQDAFTAEGLDAGDYGMFISSTWTDDDGVEQTRLGVRYSELLAFIIAGI